jgi:hypothetical protein
MQDTVAAVLAGDPLGPGVTSPTHVKGSKLLDSRARRVLRRMTDKARNGKNGCGVCSVCDFLGLELLMKLTKVHPTVISYGAMEHSFQQRVQLCSMFIPEGYWLLRLCKWCGGRHMDQMCSLAPSSTRCPVPSSGWSRMTPPRTMPVQQPKGESKDKGENTAVFNGLCYGCGKPGHRKVDCYAKVQVLYEENDDENDGYDVPLLTGEKKEFDECADEGIGVVLAVVPDETTHVSSSQAGCPVRCAVEAVASTLAARPAQRPERGRFPGVAPSKLTPLGRTRGSSAIRLGAAVAATGPSRDLSRPAPRRCGAIRGRPAPYVGRLGPWRCGAIRGRPAPYVGRLGPCRCGAICGRPAPSVGRLGMRRRRAWRSRLASSSRRGMRDGDGAARTFLGATTRVALVEPAAVAAMRGQQEFDDPMLTAREQQEVEDPTLEEFETRERNDAQREADVDEQEKCLPWYSPQQRIDLERETDVMDTQLGRRLDELASARISAARRQQRCCLINSVVNQPTTRPSAARTSVQTCAAGPGAASSATPSASSSAAGGPAGAVRRGTLQRLLLDSGSYLHVYLSSVAPNIPLQRGGVQPRAVIASGQALRCYGQTIVLPDNVDGLKNLTVWLGLPGIDLSQWSAVETKVLSSVVAKLRVMDNNDVEVIRTRGTSSWAQPVVQTLVRTLPIDCAFDGCTYGICDGNDKLHKPFCVMSISERLPIPLSLCYDKSLSHGVTRGTAATKIIGEAITRQGAVGALPEEEGAPESSATASSSYGATPDAKSPNDGHNRQETGLGDRRQHEQLLEELEEAEGETQKEEKPEEREARLARAGRQARAPSLAARGMHEVMPWCLSCIGGRAKDAERKRLPQRPEELDLVQPDYTFLISCVPSDLLMPIMIAFVQRTSYGFAHLIPVNGMITENVQKAFISWLEEAGVEARLPWLARHVEFLQNRFGIRARPSAARASARTCAARPGAASGAVMRFTTFETVNNKPYYGALMRRLGAVSEVDEKLVKDVFTEGGRAELKQKMDDMKELARDNVEKRKELKKPPQKLEKAKKVEQRGEMSEKVQKALKSTPRFGLQRQCLTFAYRVKFKRHREKVGPTDGCNTCQFGSVVPHHSYDCKIRKIEWQEKKEVRLPGGEREKENEMLDDEDEEMAMKGEKRSSLPTSEGAARKARKRIGVNRPASAIELIGLVSITGPPVYAQQKHYQVKLGDVNIALLYATLPDSEFVLVEPPSRCEALSTPSEVNTENTGDSAELNVDKQKQFQNILGKEIWNLSEIHCRGFEKVNADLEVEWMQWEQKVNVFSDSNWAAGSMRHSTSGGCIFVHGCLIASWARTQLSIALSSCEAEVVILSEAVKEAIMVHNVLNEIGFVYNIVAYIDSSSVWALCLKRDVGRRSTVNARVLWLQNLVRDKQLKVDKISTLVNPADVPTKHLPRVRHDMLVDLSSVESGLLRGSCH